MFKISITNSAKYILIVFILFCYISCKKSGKETPSLTFIITQIANNPTDSCLIELSCKEIEKRAPSLTMKYIVIENLNTNALVIPKIVDINSDGTPDFIEFRIKLTKNEPMLPFRLKMGKQYANDKTVIKNKVSETNSFSITWLMPATKYCMYHDLDENWSKTIANSIIRTYPDPKDMEIFKSYDWNYTNGFFINSLTELYKKTDDSVYLNYAEKWISLFVSDSGKIDTTHYIKSKYELDDILPGRALLNLFSETGQKKYIKAADQLMEQLYTQPRTSDSGYWHKKVYTSQMWLDGIYMADVFQLQYAHMFFEQQLTNDGIKQFLLAYNHTYDPKTGLLYHGWDESKNKIWANSRTGTSPGFWGRGIGWYFMALADGIDYVPQPYPLHDSLVTIFKNLAMSIAKYQDEKTGLWFQVVDKGDSLGNWNETSASAMFAYAFLKGYKRGLLDISFKTIALKAFNGLKNNYLYFDEEGKIYLTGTVKVGTLNFKSSDGSYSYYVSVDRRVNDFKGIASLLYLTMEMEFEK